MIWYIVVCYRQEAVSWLFMLSLEGAPVMGRELRLGPVKPQMAAL